MLPVLSATQMRELERRVTALGNLPTLLLMENAGRGAAERIWASLLAGKSQPRVVVVAGAGNNGGDGFVVARRLLLQGVRVEVFLAAPAAKLQGDALTNYLAFVALGGQATELLELELTGFAEALAGAELVVDALLGTGLDREVSGSMRAVIELVNAASCCKVSLDLPSGLHADSGRVLGVAVKADLTITFAQRKLGLCTPRGAYYAGRLEVCDIGVPSEPSATGVAAELVEAADVASLIEPRASTLHKSSAGRVLVVAGSPGKLGAALLAAHGAQRAGAGLVTIASSPAAADLLDQRVLEAMTARLDPNRLEASLETLLSPCDACVVGPGLGLDDAARRITEAVVFGWKGTKVIDADGLSHFAGRASELRRASGVVLTPHAAELGRLLSISAEAVEDDRFGAVAHAVSLTSAVVLLKGRYSIVGAPGEPLRVNPTGGPVLATGGSGDVLSGVLAALACSLSPPQAAWVGAFLHGEAADRWAQLRSADRGLLAHEIADELPASLGALMARQKPALPV